MQAMELDIPGCYLFDINRFEDDRGDFLKLFHSDTFLDLGLETNFKESYITKSHENVLRGMHFQSPPFDHAKIVSCITGRVQDGLVDLRHGSPTCGQSISFELSENDGQILYIPKGIAHGFLSLMNDSRMWYLVSSVHNSACDLGIHHNSVNITWKNTQPERSCIISQRDNDFPALSDFKSPFYF
jgi:dTDP-4-dehydrorhamnose 3,5-epimerase